MAEEPLHYVRVLPAPIDRVWRALTADEDLEGWLPGVSRIELVPGGRVWFRAASQRLAPRVGSVTAFDPPRMLRLEGPPPASQYFQFELEAVERGTRLTFRASAEPEPADAPTPARGSGLVAGIDCLGEMLTVGVSAVAVQSLTSPDGMPLSRARFLELVAVYYDQIWQKCDA